MEEESNGKAKDGEGMACGSKLRACRRTGAGDASGPGTELGVCNKNSLFAKTMILKLVLF